MPSTNLLKRDWEKEHVYLVQFPRCGYIPSPSPFALKLETWLRIADIPYTNISNDFKKMSVRGQIPFIELNGRQIADSNLIIDHLVNHFSVKHLDDLSSSDQAISRAFFTLIEHHLFWTTVYSRSQNTTWLASDKGFLKHFQGIKAFAFKKIFAGHFQRKLKTKAIMQGVGKMTKDEIIADTKKDIDAISTQLGDKNYLFGTSIKTIDATVFGHLTQLYFTPQFSEEIKNYIDSKPNLISYINRIKEKYWPDWDETTSSLNLNTNWKK